MSKPNNAIVLLSGGIDSAVTLEIVLTNRLYDNCYAIMFRSMGYKTFENIKAREIAMVRKLTGFKIVVVELCVPFSSVVSGRYADVIPARNLIFLSYAAAYAEQLQAQHIFIGVNAEDFQNFSDCRENFLNSFAIVASLSSIWAKPIYIEAPLLHMQKNEIIDLGFRLGVDFSKTISCYNVDDQGRSCGICHSCHERLDGFKKLGKKDPITYQEIKDGSPKEKSEC